MSGFQCNHNALFLINRVPADPVAAGDAIQMLAQSAWHRLALPCTDDDGSSVANDHTPGLCVLVGIRGAGAGADLASPGDTSLLSPSEPRAAHLRL